MNGIERAEAFEKFVEEQRQILGTKNKDYAAGNSDEDANYNFEIIAELMEGAPWTSYTVGLVYMLKHILSMIAFAKTRKVESEGIHGRHLDIGNYSFIMDILAVDHAKGGEEEEDKIDWVEPNFSGYRNFCKEHNVSLPLGNSCLQCEANNKL